MQQLTQPSSLLVSAVFLRDDHLDIRFDGEFDEEDFDIATEVVLSQLTQVSILEKIPGADRHNVRFRAQVAEDFGYFVLNFEVYSQSCWLEPESIDEQPLLELICGSLTGN
ncbi:DUF3630 family protein [Thalassotalea euphylliae]|nr:DUF3630 family protein [Thalassotalea euphylliae]